MRLVNRFALPALFCAALAAAPGARAAVSSSPVAPASAASAIDAGALPTVAEIVRRNLAARGGAEVWEHTLAMAWTGHVQTTGARAMSTPFVLEKARPDRSRFEVALMGQTAVRIFDGENGWKLIPQPSSRPELQPYSADELRFAHDGQAIEGPLMEYAGRQAAIKLVGVGDVDGHKAYVLEATPAGGETHRIWVDAQTFLESRLDRAVRSAAGRLGRVTILFGDYRDFGGLMMPASILTQSADGKSSTRLVIEKVVVNPVLDIHAFDKPATTGAGHRGVLVDTRGLAQTARPPQ